jgi:hypothetical protein
LTRFLPQISLRNLRKLDCYANRYPLRSKTLWFDLVKAERASAGSAALFFVWCAQHGRTLVGASPTVS